MNIWQALKSRIVAALRTQPSDPGQMRYIPNLRRHAGVTVNEDTALTYSAYFCGVRLISSAIAGMPWEVIRETPNSTTRMMNHPAWNLLKTRANPEMSAYHWRQTMIAWAITWGNGFSEIERDLGGRPLGLWPISPDRVTVRRDPDTVEIVYVIRNYRGSEPSILQAGDVFHLHGLGFDGLTGYSIVSLAARSLGLSIASEEYASDFFANGPVAAGAYKHPQHLSDEAYKRLKEDLAQKASFGQKWSPPILEEAMDWVNMTIPTKDAQLIDNRQFQVSDMSRWLAVPPHKLMDLSRATFSNIESQNREIVNDAHMPWIHPLEQEANFKLFRESERNVRTKINVRGLLRGDDISRATYYQVMRSIGAYSVNDILTLEDMDKIGTEGDIRIAQAGQTNLKSLLNENPDPSPQEPPPNLAGIRQSYAILVEDACKRVLLREAHRFEQSRHRFSDRVAFDEFRDGMRAQQSEYMEATLRPVITSLLQLFDPSATAVLVLPVLDAVIDAHLDATDQEFEGLRSGRINVFEVENRAKREASDLIEHIFAAFVEVNHEKRRAC